MPSGRPSWESAQINVRTARTSLGTALPAYLARVACGEYLPAARGDATFTTVCCLFKLRLNGDVLPVYTDNTNTVQKRVRVYNPFPEDIGDGCYLPIVRESGKRWVVTSPDCPVTEKDSERSPGGFCAYEAVDLAWSLVTDECQAGYTCDLPPRSRLQETGIIYTACQRSTDDPYTVTGPTEQRCTTLAGCEWEWNEAQSKWIKTAGECETVSPQTTPEISDDGVPIYGTTTTTTECPCVSVGYGNTGTSTTTPDPTSTTTTTEAPYECNCTYPTFCGSADGECTLTYCSTRIPDGPAECSTTVAPTTTPDCTDECPDCDYQITWHCNSFSQWVIASASGSPKKYCCLRNNRPKNCACGDPDFVQTSVACFNTPDGVPPCDDECFWDGTRGYWGYISGNCQGANCGCEPPGFPPSGACPGAVTPCGRRRPDPPRQCISLCTTTSTTAEPTTSEKPNEICDSGCVVLWDFATEMWSVLSSECVSPCECDLPVDDGPTTCNFTKRRPCIRPPTTTTTASPTTTAAPTTTTTTEQPTTGACCLCEPAGAHAVICECAMYDSPALCAAAGGAWYGFGSQCGDAIVQDTCYSADCNTDGCTYQCYTTAAPGALTPGWVLIGDACPSHCGCYDTHTGTCTVGATTNFPCDVGVA